MLSAETSLYHVHVVILQPEFYRIECGVGISCSTLPVRYLRFLCTPSSSSPVYWRRVITPQLAYCSYTSLSLHVVLVYYSLTTRLRWFYATPIYYVSKLSRAQFDVVVPKRTQHVKFDIDGLFIFEFEVMTPTCSHLWFITLSKVVGFPLHIMSNISPHCVTMNTD